MKSFLLHGIVIGIGRCESLPFIRQILNRVDRRYWAGGEARATVDAFLWVNVKLHCRRELRFIFTRMNAVARADIYTRRIFSSNARLCDDVSHSTLQLAVNEIGRSPGGKAGSSVTPPDFLRVERAASPTP